MMSHDPRDEVALWMGRFKPAGSWNTVTDEGLKASADTLWVSLESGVRRYAASVCSSTMDLAWTFCSRRLFSHNAWVIAGIQTSGRGQLGRKWLSHLGNLFVTIRLPDQVRALGNLLTLGASLVVVEALGEIKVSADIKWPNDILVGRTKVGGILIEERRGIILAGFGINLKSAPSESSGFRVPAGSISDFGAAVDVPELWNLISPKLGKRLLGWLTDSDAIREMTELNLAYKGEVVVIHDNTGGFNGPARILGMGSQGGLRVETAMGEQTLRSGQITPRVT